MAKKVLKIASTGEEIYPKTHVQCVYDGEGKTLEQILSSIGTGGGGGSVAPVSDISIAIGEFIAGYLNADGTASSSAAWAHSGFIPIAEGVPYKLTTSGWNSSFGVGLYAYYSSPQDDAGAVVEVYVNKTPDNYSNETIMPPKGARYIRFSAIDVAHGRDFRLTISVGELYSYINSLSESKTDAVKDLGFAIPTYLDCPKGMQTMVYWDNITSETNLVEDDIVITRTGFNSDIKKTREALIYTPGASDAESVVTCKRIDKNGRILYQGNITLRPTARVGGNGSAINICVSGDSLIEVGAMSVAEAVGLLESDGDYVINTIGTKSFVNNGNTYHHEGSSGWTWGRYLDASFDSYNPFMTDGVLNFQTYMADNFASVGNGKIDIFLMSLGTNDVNVAGATLESIMANAKSFIDTLLSSDKGFPNCKIILGMPAIGAPCGDKDYDSRLFQRRINLLNRAYVDTFDNGKYHPNVTLVMHGAFIDRYNTYPYADIANDYVPGVTCRTWTNFLHPTNIGYKQFGRGYYSKLRSVVNGIL